MNININDINIEDLEDLDFENIENLQFPEEMEDPEKVFGDLKKFYDEKIEELEKKIIEEESKKINFDENFLQKNKTIKRYLNNPEFMKRFNLNNHIKNAKDEINKMEAKEKNKIIDDLKNDLKEMKEQKEEFLKQKKNFQELYNNYDKIKIAYENKKKELAELQKNDSAKYEEEIKKIKERIKKNLNQLNNMDDIKENNANIEKLKGEANAYHNEMMSKKFKVRTETYTIVKRNYTFLCVALGVIGGGIIGGIAGGVGGALVGMAIGGAGGYAVGSLIST